jgi:hypothetical protein
MKFMKERCYRLYRAQGENPALGGGMLLKKEWWNAPEKSGQKVGEWS